MESSDNQLICLASQRSEQFEYLLLEIEELFKKSLTNHQYIFPHQSDSSLECAKIYDLNSQNSKADDKQYQVFKNLSTLRMNSGRNQKLKIMVDCEQTQPSECNVFKQAQPSQYLSKVTRDSGKNYRNILNDLQRNLYLINLEESRRTKTLSSSKEKLNSKTIITINDYQRLQRQKVSQRSPLGSVMKSSHSNPRIMKTSQSQYDGSQPRMVNQIQPVLNKNSSIMSQASIQQSGVIATESQLSGLNKNYLQPNNNFFVKYQNKLAFRQPEKLMSNQTLTSSQPILNNHLTINSNKMNKNININISVTSLTKKPESIYVVYKKKIVSDLAKQHNQKFDQSVSMFKNEVRSTSLQAYQKDKQKNKILQQQLHKKSLDQSPTSHTKLSESNKMFQTLSFYIRVIKNQSMNNKSAQSRLSSDSTMHQFNQVQKIKVRYLQQLQSLQQNYQKSRTQNNQSATRLRTLQISTENNKES